MGGSRTGICSVPGRRGSRKLADLPATGINPLPREDTPLPHAGKPWRRPTASRSASGTGEWPTLERPEPDESQTHDSGLPLQWDEADAIWRQAVATAAEQASSDGEGDALQCHGDALVAAGLVLFGPQRTSAAVVVLRQRAQQLRGEMSGQWSRADCAAIGSAGVLLAPAIRVLDRLMALTPQKWMIQDLTELRAAIRNVMLADVSLRTRVPVDAATLSKGVLCAYRDLLWGENLRPTLQGRPVEMVLLD